MIERRNFSFEIRKIEGRQVSGYAAVFNQVSEKLRWFKEKIAPGAFRESLASGENIFAFWNHNSDLPLAATRAKTLSLEEDDSGLAFNMMLGETHHEEFAYRKIDDGTVRSMSFGFETLDDDWNIQGGEEVRTLLRVRLFEISPVMFPAYTQTSVEARAIEEIWNRHLAQSGAAGNADKQPGLDLSLAMAINKSRQRSIRA